MSSQPVTQQEPAPHKKD